MVVCGIGSGAADGMGYLIFRVGCLKPRFNATRSIEPVPETLMLFGFMSGSKLLQECPSIAGLAGTTPKEPSGT